ncbi:MAG: murein hydrolase activator EnvC [Pseudomonadales bacterium]
MISAPYSFCNCLYKGQQRYTLAALVIAAVLLFGLMPSQAMANDIEATDEKISLLQKSIKILRQSIDTFTGKQKALKKELRAAEQDISNSLVKIRNTRSELARLEAQLQNYQQQQQILERERDDQQEAIRQALVDAYKHGRQNRIKLILNQQDPAEVERLLKYYDFINKARQQKIDSYLQTLSALENSKLAQQKAVAAQKQQAAVLAEQHQHLTLAQGERQAALGALSEQIGTAADKLANQELERDRLQGLLDEIEREVANIQLPYESGEPFATRKGEMTWPVVGKIGKQFGKRKNGSSVRWQGVVIEANSGDDISAIHDGRVVYADWFAGQGLMVLIDHGDRFLSLYAHNSSILKQTGELVSAGEVIATVGDSGGQSEPGLYFEIRSKGKPVNPLNWCR